jgi:hypothetical protein
LVRASGGAGALGSGIRGADVHETNAANMVNEDISSDGLWLI